MSPTTDDLVAHFRNRSRPPERFLVGVEQEKIAVRPSGAPVPYDGEGSIVSILDGLQARGFAPTREDGHVIALERDGDRITLEPGGQLELSGAALSTAAACRDALMAHVREVAALGQPIDVRFIAGGLRPFGRIDEVGWLPKRRYGVMREYFPRYGRSSRLAHYMMKMTATVQVNLDFSSEAEAVEKIRVGYGVTSIVTALCAASPLVEGRPSGWKSFRAAVWLETDEERCGLLPFVFEPGFSFRDYVEWALDVPMFFVVREGAYRPVGRLPFRRFLAEGFEGTRASLDDWDIHLSTVFPEVRLKRTIELRGADAGPLPVAAGLGALWRGLLDDPEARAAAWALVADRPFVDREALRREVPRSGLVGRFGGHWLRDLAVELCRIADAGLRRLPAGEGDRPLLEPLLAYASAGRSPADDMLDDYAAAGGDPAKLVERWALRG